jgi:polyhydroxyalkanoate synthesis regulator phasin
MKFKSKKCIAIISVLMALMIFGVSTSAVFAQDEKNNKENNPVFNRVAEILGIDKQQLADAFKQALKEEREQRLDQRLQEMVDEGKITQEQASEYKQWLEARPDIKIPLRPAILDEQLQKLVDEGKITEEEAAQYKEWLASKPDIPLTERQNKLQSHDRPMQKQPSTGSEATIPEMN